MQAARPMIDPLNMGCQKENFATSANDGTLRLIHDEYAQLCKEFRTCANAANDAKVEEDRGRVNRER